jgi:hypothetical protein
MNQKLKLVTFTHLLATTKTSNVTETTALRDRDFSIVPWCTNFCALLAISIYFWFYVSFRICMRMEFGALFLLWPTETFTNFTKQLFIRSPTDEYLGSLRSRVEHPFNASSYIDWTPRINFQSCKLPEDSNSFPQSWNLDDSKAWNVRWSNSYDDGSNKRPVSGRRPTGERL